MADRVRSSAKPRIHLAAECFHQESAIRNSFRSRNGFVCLIKNKIRRVGAQILCPNHFATHEKWKIGILPVSADADLACRNDRQARSLSSTAARMAILRVTALPQIAQCALAALLEIALMIFFRAPEFRSGFDLGDHRTGESARSDPTFP